MPEIDRPVPSDTHPLVSAHMEPCKRVRYLFPARAGGERPAAQVLSCHAGTEEIERGAFVVRDEGDPRGACYLLFPDGAARFWEWSTLLPPERRAFHEVVFGQLPQRLKFDIDATPERAAALPGELLERLCPGFLGGGSAAALDRELEFLLEGKTEPHPPSEWTTGNKMEAALCYLVNLIVDVFEARYPREALPLSRVAVTSSLGEGEPPRKYSYHIVVTGYAVANYREAQAFTEAVLDEVRAEAPDLVPLIDPQVNSATQNFRLLGSQKLGSGRPKILSPSLSERLGTAGSARHRGENALRKGERFLVRKADEDRLLPALVESPGKTPQEDFATLTDEDEKKVLKLVAERSPAFAAHRFRRRINGLFVFERLRPSHCSICHRTHENDNTLMVACRPPSAERLRPAFETEAGTLVEVVELCRRCPDQGETLGVVRCSPEALIVSASTAAKKTRSAAARESFLASLVGAIREGRRDPHASADKLFEQLPPERKTVYDEPSMRPYELSPTLAVKAQMGLGKTKALRNYLEVHYPTPEPTSLEPAPVIRYVTFRQTFSESLRRAFPDFRLYSDLNSPQILADEAPRLVVQVESLQRLSRAALEGERVDLLILDEVESVLAQFSSGLHRSFDDAFTVFQWLLASAGRVVCMDANLSDRTYRVLERFRPGRPAHFHWNSYSRCAGDRVEVGTCRDAWLGALLDDAAQGKRVAVATNVLREAKATAEVLARELPDLRVKLYSSETPQGEKNTHFADVDRHWSEPDVLIYTPTVSAGVSYERLPEDGGFDLMYVYLSDSSCDVETARQMMGRVRALRERTFRVCLKTWPAAFPTDLRILERVAYERRRLGALSTGPGGRPATFAFDPACGEVRPYRSPFFPLWLENQRVTNLSRNAYAARFVDQVADTGAEVALLSPAAGRPPEEVREARAEAAGAVEKRECEALAAAEELTPEAASELRTRERAARGEGVTPSERVALQKFYIRGRYGWRGEITPNFAADYRRRDVQEIYSNLSLLLGWGEPELALAALAEQEGRGLLVAGAGADRLPPGVVAKLEHNELVRRRRLPAHYYAVWFLRLCEFRHVNDCSSRPEPWLQARFWHARGAVAARLRSLQNEYDLRRPPYAELQSSDSAEVYKTVLRLANHVLKKMYGVYLSFRKTPAGVREVLLARSPKGRLFRWPGDLPTEELPAISGEPPAVREASDEKWDFLLWRYCLDGPQEEDVEPPAPEPPGEEDVEFPGPELEAGPEFFWPRAVTRAGGGAGEEASLLFEWVASQISSR